MTSGQPFVPGQVVAADGDIELNVGRTRHRFDVVNTGDRPVQVGSHFHFAEANDALAMDRRAAHGMRLDVPAGTSIRFEPGIARVVDLVAFAGDRIASGFRGLVGGPLDGPADPAAASPAPGVPDPGST